MTTTARVLAGRLADLLRRERAEMAEFLLALAEFDEQRGWLELGYSSLFYFLHRELGLSKGAAHYRKTAAGLVRRFPEIIEPLRDGRLCITSVVHVAKVLTAENRHEVLPRFFQRSRRDARAVAAALQPTAAPHRDVITAAGPTSAPLRASSAACVTPAVQPAEPGAAAAARGASADGEVDPPPAATSLRPDSAEPLTSDLSRLHITVSRRFLEKLEAARAALSHTHDASAESILEAGLDLVLKRHAARRGLVEKPRAGKDAAETSGLPASVKRQVWTRDGGRCQWPLESGGVCQSTVRVEYDHIIPRAMGGPSRPENLRLLCRFHNDLAARRAFGGDWMNQFTRDPASRKRPPGS
jgi:HNH endonuclease